MAAVASSIRGYWMGVGRPQPLQRPRRKIQEKTGMFSYQANAFPHRGQRDLGRTTDCFGSAPQRRMHTLRKMPRMAPSTPAKITQALSAVRTSAVVQQDSGGHRHVERLALTSQRDSHLAISGCI